MSYRICHAMPSDVDGARSVMLDTFYREFAYGYQPRWHADVIDVAGTYLNDPRHALFVAKHGDEVVATTAVRSGGPQSPPHPAWLAARYPNESTAQLFRVYVRKAHRRRGLARALVAAATRFVAQRPDYQALYLHTDTRIRGAEEFWRSVATEVHDARDHNRDHFQTVHFEIALSSHRGSPGSADGRISREEIHGAH